MGRPLVDALDDANPNTLPSAAQLMKLGSSAEANMALFGTFAVASDVAVLPNTQKAQQVLSVFVRAGTLTGYLAVVAEETTPTTGQCAVNASGDVEFAAADAVTSAEITYIPCEGDLVEETVDVASSTATLLASKRARKLISAEVLTGASPGAVTPVARGTSSPSSGDAAIQVGGDTVKFNAAQVVAGTALLTYLATPSVGTAGDSLADRLAGDCDII